MERLNRNPARWVSSVCGGASAALARIRGRARVHKQHPGRPHDRSATVRLSPFPTTGPVALECEKDPANPIPPHLEEERFLGHIRTLMASATPRLLADQRRYKADYDWRPAPAGPPQGWAIWSTFAAVARRMRRIRAYSAVPSYRAKRWARIRSSAPARSPSRSTGMACASWFHVTELSCPHKHRCCERTPEGGGP